MELITFTRLHAYQWFHEAHRWHCCTPLFVRRLPGNPWLLGQPNLLLAHNTARVGQLSPAATGCWSRSEGRPLRSVHLRRHRTPPHIQMLQRAVEEAGEVGDGLGGHEVELRQPLHEHGDGDTRLQPG
jgi:hypothetical protein